MSNLNEGVSVDFWAERFLDISYLSVFRILGAKRVHVCTYVVLEYNYWRQHLTRNKFCTFYEKQVLERINKDHMLIFELSTFSTCYHLNPERSCLKP